jgi:drug/metabolite transporter (DMT)-like permease
VHGALLLVSLLFGLSFVAVKLVLDEVPARAWAFYRVLFATCLLVPLGLGFSRGKPLPPLRVWLWLLPASILGVVLNQALFALGLERTTPAHSALIVSTIPILTLGLALLVRQEQIDRRKLIGMGCAFLGVLILIEADQMFLAGFEFGETAEGDLFTLCNACSFACFLVLMRKVAKGVDAFQTTAICFLYATVLLGIWSWPALSEENFDVLLESNILPFAAYAVIGGTVLTYFLNNWALRYTPSSQVAVYTYVQPLVATVLSMSLGQDSPDLRFFLAAILVFLGVMR